jgi:hypothetical protein
MASNDGNPERGPRRWWQWPTVLSLDAPAVALAWQWEMARAAGVTLGVAPRFVLAASVWLSYAGDRWLEGLRLAPAQILTHRHSFYQRRRRAIAVVGTAVLAADLAVAERYLPPADLMAGLVLLGAVLAYLLSHQLIHRRKPWRLPKEACVALLLTSGAALFVLAGRPALWLSLSAPLGLFAGLCFANCALISRWEREVDRGHGQTSLVRQFRGAAAFSRALPWALAALAAVAAVAAPECGRPAALCACASGLLLGLVDLAEPRLGRQAARVLADVALLTPAGPLLLQAARHAWGGSP